MNLGQLGEKRLIAEVIRPLFNPESDPNSVGDDCAIIDFAPAGAMCFSTDRVPADLISYKLGLIDIGQMGYYLAILNISDLAAAGATPAGLLLNLAFPRSFPLEQFNALLQGVQLAAQEYRCPVLGGDLSDAPEINLVATSIGTLCGPNRVYRSGAKPGHLIFCCDVLGLTATAFAHFGAQDRASPALSRADVDLVCSNFRSPRARVQLGSALRESGACSSMMDNTDGVGQSLSELSIASGVAMHLDEAALPIASASRIVARHLGLSLSELVLGPGADFQLIGTIDSRHAGFADIASGLHIIGVVEPGSGIWLRRSDQPIERLHVHGWNYYAP